MKASTIRSAGGPRSRSCTGATPTTSRSCSASSTKRAPSTSCSTSLVNIYEFGQTTDGSAYIVMEYLNGDTLRQRLERSGGRLAPRCRGAALPTDGFGAGRGA